MAWTPAQLAKARKLFKARGNKKTWSECVGLACKGGARKPAKKAVKRAVSGTGVKKKTATKKVTVVKARAKKVNVNIGGLGSIAMDKVKTAVNDIARLEKMKAAAPTAAERKKITNAISGVRKYKNSLKKYF